jgi:hypothetical protein
MGLFLLKVRFVRAGFRDRLRSSRLEPLGRVRTLERVHIEPRLFPVLSSADCRFLNGIELRGLLQTAPFAIGALVRL